MSVAEGARRLAEGDLDYRVKAISMDETQELAAAFNTFTFTIPRAT
ncbi:MAG: HAMP domain-containing protein [Chloroflexi bacterium]|nr:HAMP domain-containing protein [Chloroflexota bacterium]